MSFSWYLLFETNPKTCAIGLLPAMAKQAIAIGLSEARRAGVDLKPPKKGTVSEKTRKSAISAYEKGQHHEPVSPTRSRASHKLN